MTITREVQKYIQEHPSVRDCLRGGLINYSALARLICDTMAIDRFDAVLVACRRYAKRSSHAELRERKILQLVRRAQLKMENKRVGVIVEKPKDFERIYSLQKEVKKEGGAFTLIEGEEAITIISSEDFLSDIRSSLKGRIIKINEGLIQISMIFPVTIEVTPGVMAYIHSLLSENDINIVEEMSCWTDLIMLVHEEDIGKAMKVLNF